MNPEELQQLRKLQEAAVLASQDKFRCQICSKVHLLKDGIVIVARKNILLGVCMECSKRATIMMRPMPNGEGMQIGIEAMKPSENKISLASVSDIRAVETSKLSMQRAEKTELGGNGR